MAGYVSNQIFMSAIDDGSTIHGSLLSDRSLSQGYVKNEGTYVPNWNATTGPTIYLTLLDGATPIAPSGWSAATQEAVVWKWNGNEIAFDENGKSTGSAMYDGQPLFQRTTQTWQGITMPALKIIYNMARAGSLNNDVITMEGKVEMSGEPIDFSAGVTVQLGEASSNGYHGGIYFPEGSVILTDDQWVTAVGELYSGGGAVTEFRCLWELNGEAVTATSASGDGRAYVTSSSATHGNDTLHVSGDDDSGVLDIATVTCKFQVKDEEGNWQTVFVITETIDDQGDEQYLYVNFTLGGTTAKINGAPVSLHRGQSVVWDAYVGLNSDASVVLPFNKFEYRPQKADGSFMADTDFSADSGSPLNNAAKWKDGWCDITTGSNHGGFACHFNDIHNAGKNIGGIIRASKTTASA